MSATHEDRIDAVEQKLTALDAGIEKLRETLTAEGASDREVAESQMKAMLGRWEDAARDTKPGESWRPTVAEREAILKGKSLDLRAAHAIKPDDGWQGELLTEYQKAADTLYIVNAILNGVPSAKNRYMNGGDSEIPPAHPIRELRSFKYFRNVAEKVCKSFNMVDDPGFMPTEWSDQYIRAITMAPTVASKVRQFNIPMDDFVLPIGGQPIVPFTGVSQRSDAGEHERVGKPASGHVTFQPAPMALQTFLSEKASEASIIPAAPYIMERLVEGAQLGEDHIILNGDTTWPHMDSGVTDTGDVRTMFDGLRHYAIANSLTVNVGGAGSFEPADLHNIRAKMNRRYRHKRESLVWITTDLVRSCIETLSSFAAWQTVMGVGQALATNVTSKLLVLQGAEVVVSPAASECLDATGYDTGTFSSPMTQDETPGGSMGMLLLLDSRAWAFGRVGGVRSYVTFNPGTAQYELVVREYVASLPLFSGEAFLSYGYNVPQAV